MPTETTGEDANFFVVGQTSVDQCYDALNGGCQPNHCEININDACNNDVPLCTADDGQPKCEGRKVSG